MKSVDEKSEKDALEERSVIEAVRKYIKGYEPGGSTLEVVEQGIHKDDSWWYIPIRPSVEPVKRYEYYEALADVEIELEEKENLTVLLVPMAPR